MEQNNNIIMANKLEPDNDIIAANNPEAELTAERPESLSDLPPLYPGYTKPVAEQPRGRSRFFNLLFIPSLLYALAFAFCVYDNAKGILMGVVAAVTIIYCRYAKKKEGIAPKHDRFWYEFLLVLLGISCGLTDNTGIVFFNIVGMGVTLFAMLLHDFYDDREWTLPKYFAQFFKMLEGIIAGVAGFFYDVIAVNRADRDSKNKTGTYILLGLLIAAPLLAVIILLLSSADYVFMLMLKNVFCFTFTSFVLVLIVFAVGFFASYAILRAFLSRPEEVQIKEVSRFDPVIAITVFSVISVVYVVFSGIQIAYLFIGNMTLPGKYTYAQYAREGFFQLLVVCILNLLIVLFTLARFSEHPALKGLLTVISACTYIMLASSALRMFMYIDVYYLTRKRVLVLWGLSLIAVLLIGVVIQIFRKKFPLLRYGMIVCALFYLVLSFGRMDYIIAKYNTEHILPDSDKAVEADDLNADQINSLAYLSTLSADAAPVILEYATVRDDSSHYIYIPLTLSYDEETNTLKTSDSSGKPDWVYDYKFSIKDVREDSVRRWNLSRFTAKKLLGDEKLDRNPGRREYLP